MSNIATKEEMKAEAIKRMRMLKMDDALISALRDDDIIFYSENLGQQPFNAVWYSLDSINNHTEAYKEFWALINELSEEYGGFAYHGQLTHYVELGDCYTILYVSQHKDEWAYEHDALTLVSDPEKEGYVCCYPIAYVKSGPFTEFSSVKIRPSIGGIVRI